MSEVINTNDQVIFETLKESRDWYFVEYRPPIINYRFATLDLVIVREESINDEIVQAMEAELTIWLNRYPIPIMVSAFNNLGDLIEIKPTRKSDHLIGYVDNNKIINHWKLLKDEEIPSFALDRSYLLKVYKDISFKTKHQLKTEIEKKYKNLRFGWWIVFSWAVIVPAIIAIIEWWSDWLGIIVLLYSFWKAIEKSLRMLGKWPKSQSDINLEAENARIQHHHYHCNLNPEGFLRLKAENFDTLARNKISEEAALLKKIK